MTTSRGAGTIQESGLEMLPVDAGAHCARQGPGALRDMEEEIP
jgi:hypothetical protein